MTSILTLVQARLQSQAPYLPSVEVIEHIGVLEKGTAPRSGAAFVAPHREVAEPNQLMTGGFRQLVHVEFLTAFLIRLDDDLRGAERVLRFEGYKSQIETALAGWEPDELAEEVALVGCEGGRLSQNTSVYIQTWETARYLNGA